MSGDTKYQIASLLEQVIKGITDQSGHVSVEVRDGEQTTVFVVYCAKDDLGKVIGKQGSMAKALRTILTSLAAKNQIRAVMEIAE